MSEPHVSIVVPAFCETTAIVKTLRRLAEAVTTDHEILVVVDSPDDTTIEAARPQLEQQPKARIIVQNYGPGPANAIRYGVDHASSPCVVVTMADGSDEAAIIDSLVRLVEEGNVVAAASRYMKGGRQIGGPRLKRVLSQAAGLSLHWLAGVGTRDATNSFKAYQTAFVREVGIASTDGFEIGIELVAKARRARRPVAEIPTVWLDRVSGESRFRFGSWLPMYLHWYRFAFGGYQSPEALCGKSAWKGWRPS